MNYIEMILVVNGIISFLLIKNSSLLAGCKLKKRYIALALLLDTIYMLVYILNPRIIGNGKYIIILGISGVSFFSTGRLNLFKCTIFYLLQNFLLGGVSEILYISQILKWYMVLILIVILIIISIIYKELTKNHFNINSIYYDIKIIHENKQYYLKGFCDTGNFLLDDGYVPIVFVDSRFQFGRFVKLMDCHSVGIKNNIKVYEVDQFYIKIRNKYYKRIVYIARSNINSDAMFGVTLLGG